MSENKYSLVPNDSLDSQSSTQPQEPESTTEPQGGEQQTQPEGQPQGDISSPQGQPEPQPQQPQPEPTPTPAAQTPEAAPEPVKSPEPEATTPEPAPKQEEVDPYELLGLPKGGGDFAKIIDAWKAGSLEDYLKVSTANYDKMADQDVLRIAHDKDFEGLSKEERDALWEIKLENEYNITGDPELDKNGLLKMKADAYKVRSGLKAEQAKYQIPKYEAPQPDNTKEIEAQKEAERMAQTIRSMPEVRQLEASKVLQLGQGNDAYNLELPFSVTKAALEENLLADFWIAKDGGQPQFDVRRFALAKAIAQDPDGIAQKLINHGRSLQEKKQFEELNNPAPATPTGVPASTPKYQLVK